MAQTLALLVKTFPRDLAALIYGYFKARTDDIDDTLQIARDGCFERITYHGDVTLILRGACMGGHPAIAERAFYLLRIHGLSAACAADNEEMAMYMISMGASRCATCSGQCRYVRVRTHAFGAGSEPPDFETSPFK